MATQANYRWQVTTARVVTVDCCGPIPRGSLQTFPSILAWPVKDPGDTLDYVVDYSDILAGDVGDAVATLDVSISPNQTGDLALRSSNAEGTQAILWLTSGQAGTTYSVTVTSTTNNGRAISRTVYLPVAALSVPTLSNSAITDQNGLAITDQVGSPITV